MEQIKKELAAANVQELMNVKNFIYLFVLLKFEKKQKTKKI